MTDHADETTGETFPAYDDITVEDLKAALEGNGLATTGLKPELYERLRAFAEGDKEPAAEEPEAEPAEAGVPIPVTYTVEDETHYVDVARKFNIGNYRELGALNGVTNSRYDLKRGDVVKLPQLPDAD